MVAAATVVEKTPLELGITPAFRTREIVPSQRRSILSDLPLLVPVTASPEAPVAGYVMYEGSAGSAILVAVGAAIAGAASALSAATASSAARAGRVLMARKYSIPARAAAGSQRSEPDANSSLTI